MTAFRKMKLMRLQLRACLLTIGALTVACWWVWGELKMKPNGHRRRVESDMACLVCGSRDFRLDTGRWPERLTELLDGKGIENWDGPYAYPLPGLEDPWGRPYHCVWSEKPEKGLYVFTLGRDGLPGGTGTDRDYQRRITFMSHGD